MWVELCDLVVEHAEEMLDSASTMALLSSTSSAAIVASGVGGGSGFTNTAVSSDGGEINTTSSSSTSLDLTAILNLPSSTDSLSFLDIDRILRTGITKFSGGGGGGGSSNNNDSSSSSSTIASTTTTVAGKLWTALGKWYILLSQFEKARDIYEEAMASVTSVRDFSLVFDAYAEFEESLLTAKMEALARKQQQLQQGNDEEEDDDEEGGDEVDVVSLFNTHQEFFEGGWFLYE